jgi:unsaturated chondroitin disaccharide hydrolase
MMLLSGCATLENNSEPKVSLDVKFDVLVNSLSDKVTHAIGEFGDSLSYPRSTTSEGKWKTIPIRDWTSGFFPGILWYMNELTGDSTFRSNAERWTVGLTPLQYYSGSHDIGFMVFCSFGNGYRLTNKEEYKNVILRTANTLTSRFNPTVGSIKSWDNRKWQYPVIIDNMMNLELLFWSAKNGGTQNMYDVAVRHAEQTMKNHFRPDGSTFHVVSYDTLTGNVIAQVTHQGYADASCWSRGQAWAIYGFTMTYRFTNDDRFLQTAQRAADYFIAHLPNDKIPYWDFNAPNIPNESRDASAASIAASGLLELSSFVKDADRKQKYYATAVSILESLMQPPYFSKSTTASGILNFAVGNKPAGTEINVSLIYGDYYFIEALKRYRTHRVNDVIKSTAMPAQH